MEGELHSEVHIKLEYEPPPLVDDGVHHAADNCILQEHPLKEEGEMAIKAEYEDNALFETGPTPVVSGEDTGATLPDFQALRNKKNFLVSLYKIL
jgi:hypothetical protein